MDNQQKWNAGAAYSGMAIQMGVIIALGTFGGVKLDQWLELSPVFTIICALISIALAMYVMIQKFTKKKKDGD